MERQRSRTADQSQSPAQNGVHHRSRGSRPKVEAPVPQHTLLEFLKIDPRPTFILDVTTFEPSEASFRGCHVFSNPAFTNSPSLQHIVGAGDGQTPGLDHFNSWLKTCLDEHADSSSHFQSGHLWTGVLLNDKWIVVSGVRNERDADSSDSVSSQDELVRNGNATAGLHLGRGSEAEEYEALKLQDRNKDAVTTDTEDLVPFAHLPPSDHLTFIREFDWSSTTLGPISTWSAELKQACSLMICDPDPCTIFWGEDLALIWNEQYIALAGQKHPDMFGLSARLSWGEVWDQYDPLFNQMRLDGKSFKQENARLSINRNGYLEDAFFNLRVIPIQNQEGKVLGFYEPVSETTRQVLSGRRLETLLEVGENISSSTSIEDLWRALLNALRGHQSDVYFAALYVGDTSKDSGEDSYVLKGGVGLDCEACFPRPSPQATPGEDDPAFQSAFKLSRESKTSVVLRMTDGTLSQNLQRNLRNCGLKDDCRSIVISPLKFASIADMQPMLVIGTSPRHEFNDEYSLFIELLVRQIENSVTSVELFEKERELLKEQANRQSEIRIRTFADMSPVGIFIFDPEGSIKFCNDAWLELCGLSRDRIHEPMCWVETVHPENASEIQGYWEKIARNEGPQTFEVQYKKPWRPKGGDANMSLDRTYVLASAYAEVDHEGNLTGILGSVTDISHVKWAEKIQAQRLEEALELKRQQENFLDITSHEMRNPLNAILHCAAELEEHLTALISDNQTSKPKTTILSESLDAASTIAYCGKHQKRIIDDVLTVSKLDSDLLAISPLSSRPTQIVRQVLSVFETEIRASLIEAELVISPSYKELNVESVMIDPHRCVQIVINLVSNAIKHLKGESRRTLRIVLGASENEPSNGDEGVKFVPSGRHREDPTSKPEWGEGEILFLTFSIQDTGPGMTPEEANSLFHRFIQGSPRTHAQYAASGSGLGLFISRELTELSGGRIGLFTEVNDGTTFSFYVKARRDVTEPKTPSSPTTSSAPHSIVQRLRDSAISADTPPLKEVKSSPSVMQVKHTDRLKVLIVEDNLINQQILKKLLRKQGYEVSIANHGREALDIIESSQWHVNRGTDALKLHVVLCDVEMPVMDGKATVQKIRQMQKGGQLVQDIPVIAVTGNARPEQIRKALECGFDDVVSKPYEVHDITARVAKFTTG